MITIKMPLNQREEIITLHSHQNYLFLSTKYNVCLRYLKITIFYLHNSYSALEDCKPNFIVFTKC